MDFENGADIHTDEQPSIQAILKLENLEPETEVSDNDIAALDFRDLVLEDTEQGDGEPEDRKPNFIKAGDVDSGVSDAEVTDTETTEPGTAEPDEPPARKMLKRDVNRGNLIRLEESARTEEEFGEVKRWWKRLDANRMRKERYWEQLMSSDMFDWDLDDGIPYYAEDTLTLIFFCPCKMHELVEHPDIYRLIQRATKKQKAVFFPRILVGCSAAKVAACHEMTDRNVRKLIDTMLDNLRGRLHIELKKRHEAEQPMAHRELTFLKEYIPKEKKERGRPKKEPAESADEKDYEKDYDKTAHPQEQDEYINMLEMLDTPDPPAEKGADRGKILWMLMFQRKIGNEAGHEKDQPPKRLTHQQR